MTANILIIDDDPDACDLLKEALEAAGMKAESTLSARDGFDLVSHHDFDVVLTDLTMSEMDGLEVCRRVRAVNPAVPVLVVTGAGSMDTAIAAMRAGAYDFITKPVDPSLLAISVARAVEHKTLHAAVRRLRETVDISAASDGLIGSSRAMMRVHEVLVRVAASDAPVLIHGETGVGKELVARRIHDMSTSKRGPFIAINCAAIPAALLESELFGHARGAFTDAKSDRTGLFVQANHGTLFLDEIGEMPVELQPKLLRALQQRTVRPVGGNSEIPFDVRVVAASNRDLEEEVIAKRFREDLYYRINVVRVALPPLREREGDVIELAQYFLAQHAANNGGKKPLEMSREVIAKLRAYRWPGNVRELENCIARAVAFARYDDLRVDDLPEKVQSYEPERFVISANDELELMTLSRLEDRYIQRVLALMGGNKSRAAIALGIDRRTLYRKAEKRDGRAKDGGPEA